MAKALSPKEYAVFLYETGDSEACLEVLQKNNSFHLIDKIIEEFKQYDKAQKGITVVEVSSAKPLDNKIKESIRFALGSEKKFELTEKVVPDLMAGLVIRIGDTMIDGSLKTKLVELNQSLT